MFLNYSEDSCIINEILKGDIDSYEKIISKYESKLYGYIFKLVRNEHVAQDILQETFLKAYINLSKYNKKKDFSPWILKIARNNVLDYFKKKKNHSIFELNENTDSIEENKTDEIPHKALEEKENTKQIDKVINSLPDKYRILIILKYFNDLNYKEISERMNISVDKVKWRLYEARKTMAKELRHL